MSKALSTPEMLTARLKRTVTLTQIGMIFERLTRAFWPVWTIVFACLTLLMLGLHEFASVIVLWVVAFAFVAGFAIALWSGIRRYSWPSRSEAKARLDETLPNRPIAALEDSQAIGSGDAASEAIWAVHVRRMEEKTHDAKVVKPDLTLVSRDPFALRYIALTGLVIALLFGSIWRVSSVADIATGGGDALAQGPAWEGWIEPPAYTGRPSLYLNDIDNTVFAAPVGSQVTLRFYGEVGTLVLGETVSGRIGELPPASDPVQVFNIARDGMIQIQGRGGREWNVRVLADEAPEVAFDGRPEPASGGELRQSFVASDDHGVVSGQAIITLDLGAVDRRYGLALEPEPRDAIEIDLPMTITGDRANFSEILVENFAEHPWAGLPVRMSLLVQDDLGQEGQSETAEITLPGRRFFDPLASAIAEQRRDLLWNKANAQRATEVLRAVSYEPDDIFRAETEFLKLRFAVRRLERALRDSGVSDELRDETAQVLWDIALQIEEGDLSDALERLRRAQDQLAEAIENGATDEEIAELLDELREAMQEYMRQLAERAEDNPQTAENQGQPLTSNQLEEMLQRLQELTEQGRTAEAQALLEQLRQLMENLQFAEGQQGQGQQGQQALQDLAETLREQQELSDETFGDLQDQFNPGQQQPGQQQPGQNGQQQPGQQQQGQGQGGSEPSQQGLADRQQALQNQLRQQQGQLPGAGTEEGQAARDALDRAGRAMREAEENLRDENFAGALDDQSNAMEALREGIRELGEALAQEGQQGQQGEAFGQADERGQRDPLGREAGNNGRLGTDQELLGNEDVNRRAAELLDEIRRRSGEQNRPEQERDYLRRLLDRF